MRSEIERLLGTFSRSFFKIKKFPTLTAANLCIKDGGEETSSVVSTVTLRIRIGVSIYGRRGKDENYWLITKLWFVFKSSTFVVNNHYGLNVSRKCMYVQLSDRCKKLWLVSAKMERWKNYQWQWAGRVTENAVCIRFGGRWKHRLSLHVIVLSWQTIVWSTIRLWVFSVNTHNRRVKSDHSKSNRQTDVRCRLIKNYSFLLRLLRLPIAFALLYSF